MVNKFRILILFLVANLFFYSCINSGEAKKDCVSNNSAEKIIVNGVEREYILYIPSTYNTESKVPLLLNFHGFGGKASEYMSYSDFRNIAERDTFILVYPQGSCLNGFTHWNAALPSPENKSSADDLGFIDALVGKLTNQYNIDNQRIYSTGYSNGAFFSYALACYRSELIAAIGSVSGTMLDTSNLCTPNHPTAIIDIHGTADGVIPYSGNKDYISINSVIDYWTHFNNTSLQPNQDSFGSNGYAIDHFVFSNGNAGVTVEHFKVNGGGHIWFDFNYKGKNVNEIIWDFLSRYDVNGLRN